jgi:hypothetical protein
MRGTVGFLRDGAFSSVVVVVAPTVLFLESALVVGGVLGSCGLSANVLGPWGGG